MTPAWRPRLPLAPLLLGGLVALALIGAALGALGNRQPAAPVVPPATPSLLVAGGSAWPAPETPSPTARPTAAAPTPTQATAASPSVSARAGFEVQVCRRQRGGRCDHPLGEVRGGFVVLVSFADSSRGDRLSIRLEGPGGRTVDGASLGLGGGAGAGWSSFRGGLARGQWAAVATLNGAEVGRTTFAAR